MPEQEQSREQSGKLLLGTVVGDRMDKTLRVNIDRRVRHPLYGKYITRSTRLLAHDEQNEGRVGDVVLLEPSRPLSKRKAWRLHRVVTRAKESS